MKPWFFIFFILPLLGFAYVVWHVWQILPLPPTWKYAAVTVMSLPVLCLFSHFLIGPDQLPLAAGRVVYEVGTSSLFVLLYLVMIFILLDAGRLLRLVPQSLLHHSVAGSAGILVFVCVLFIYANINYRDKQMRTMELRAAQPLSSPLRIVMLSDMHIGYHNNAKELERWVEMINASSPDVVLIAGDIIEAIDGQKIKAGEDWSRLLVSKAGNKVLVTVNKGRKSEEIYVDAGRSDYDLLYRRWVRQREEMVEKLSGGRIGYVHVAGMNSDSFREVYSKLLGKYRTAEAVIVDTRNNGGGWLHDDLATLLDGKAYIKFEPRGQYIGTEPYNKWTKPSCVLIGENNYSDACGFPYVYKTLGIGKLIGAPVPGTMTAVWWEQQIDPTIIFGIPQVGAVGLKEGRYLENMQIEPDILVYNDPASVLAGEDSQLEAAVREMLKEIGADTAAAE